MLTASQERVQQREERRSRYKGEAEKANYPCTLAGNGIAIVAKDEEQYVGYRMAGYESESPPKKKTKKKAKKK